MSRPSVVLDAGALIAFERNSTLVRQYVLLAARGAVDVSTSSAVVAQVWRGGHRQARLSRLLRSQVMEESPLDERMSRRIGALAAGTKQSDVVDGHVALLAEDRSAVVVTSDPSDLERWGVDASRLVPC